MFVSVGIDVDMETVVVAVATAVVGVGEATNVDVVGSAVLESSAVVVVTVVTVAVVSAAMDVDAVGTSWVVGVLDDAVNAGTGPIVHASTAAVASVSANAARFAIMALYVCGSVGSYLPAVRTGKTSTGGRYDSSPQRVTRTGKTGTRDVHEGKT